MRNRNKYKIISAGLMVLWLFNPVILIAEEEDIITADQEIKDLAQQIKSQRDAIDALQDRVGIYEKQIKERRNQALSIKNELANIEDQIAKTKLELEIKKQEIMSTNLKIAQTEKNIDEKNKKIEAQKDRIAEFIRLLYQNSQKSYVEIFLSDEAIADFFTQEKYLQTVEENTHVLLQKVKSIKEKLAIEKEELGRQHEELVGLREKLTDDQVSLEEKITAKNVMLETTQADESKFQVLLDQVRAEQAQINSDIVNLEKQIRARLAEKGDKTLSELSGQGFLWPVSSRTITAQFHDPDYPFRRYFEHPAIDIRAKQGTPIKAIGSGYVSRARDGGMGYSYISIVHADGLSSVYGHVSCILVAEDEFVVQGQVIGCSGATPGTPGAGRLTTGPHLHLEIRLNGIPINPINYLP